MTKPSSISVPQRLALELQQAHTNLATERARVQQLLSGLEQMNSEVDRLRGSMSWESNSRLQAEEALNETRDRLQLAVEAAGLALWEWDLGSTNVRLSERWAEMVGDLAIEGYWAVTALAERVHPEDLPQVKAQLRELLKQEKLRAVLQYRVRTEQGWLWIETHGMVAERDRSGRARRLMGTHADISERKLAEEAGQRARDLAEQASNAKSDFLANISHEVRTPLNAIMGLASLLAETTLDANQRHWLELMNNSSQTLLALLNDVLDFSRMDAGKLQLEDVPFDLSRELSNAATLYKQQSLAKSIRFSFDLDPALPDRVRGDAVRLRQILDNLLSNALKFTPSGGQIALRGLCSVFSGEHTQWLQLEIEDSGVGISLDKQATIFDAFTQADPSTARHFGGSGLGLAICARLVKLMGGQISLKSAPGEGCCFTVQLPLREELPTLEKPSNWHRPTVSAAQFDQHFPDLRVLVAEDHPVNELLIRRLLERMGCSVQRAVNGEEAVAEWQKGGLDLILMDVQMPGTNGLQATRRIRELEAACSAPRTPIVAVTANAMHGDKDLYLASGFDSYASKPIVLDSLVQAMETALACAVAVPASQISVLTAHQPAEPLPSAGEPNRLADLLGADVQTLQVFVQRLDMSMNDELELLHQAHAARSLEQVLFATHRLGSSLGFLSAGRALRMAKGLELSARSGDWGLFLRALPLLKKEIEAAMAAAAPTA